MTIRATIAYDIADPRGRKRARKLLELHGDAVNFSVFEVQLRDEVALDALLDALARCIATAHDSVRATLIDRRSEGRWRGVRHERKAVAVI